MPTGNVVCSQTNADLVVPYLDGVIPEAAAPSWRARDFVDVVDQYVDGVNLASNFLKQFGAYTRYARRLDFFGPTSF